jgi:hypothetical protein
MEKIEMTSSAHSYHGYEIVLHHESGDRYQVTIFDPKSNRIESTRPARTWSDRALLLRRRDTSITFSRNDGPHEACALLIATLLLLLTLLLLATLSMHRRSG